MNLDCVATLQSVLYSLKRQKCENLQQADMDLPIELFFSDSSTESDEEAIIFLRRRRKQIRDASNPLEMDAKTFISNFRICKEAFIDVLGRIDQRLTQSTRRHGIPNILKLAIALRFFAQGSYQLNVGNEGMFGYAQPTVSLVLKEILSVMESTLCPEFISFQYTAVEEDSAKLYFYNYCQIPGVIGAIDGTHIKLAAPLKSTQHLYYNRKGFHSINAMIVCDHLMKIRYINATFPGSSHDSHVFNVSSLKSHLDELHRNGERNTFLLGDGGYAIQPYLMTPYRNAEEGSIERRFNIHHTKGRNVIERVNGVLKNRWRCLLGARALHYAAPKATQIINVCAALHNICIIYRTPFEEEGYLEEVEEEEYNTVFNTESHEAEAIREAIARSLPN